MALLTLAIVSCTTEEEKMLEGEWQGEVSETDDDGDETIYRVGMSFNKEDDIMKLTVVYRDPDLGEYARMSVSGQWMAVDDEITLFGDEDSLKVEFSPQTEIAAEMLGLSSEDFEEMLSDMLRSQVGMWEDIKVYSLSSRSMTIDFDGSRLKMHKI